MPEYRRPKVAGATIFFTVAVADRGSDLLVREIGLLREAVRATRAERPFGVDAWVVLPDHLHCVWTLPAGDADFSTRWGAIKARFSRSVREEGSCRAGFSPPMHSAAPQICLAVGRAEARPTGRSSIHRDIRLGRVEPEWAGAAPDGDFGE